MSKVFIIAEAGVNHNGSLELARRLVDVAVEAGVDAIKFQTFKADELVTQSAKKAEYQQFTTDKTESQLEMLRKLELSDESHKDILEYCRLRGIKFLSTPFDFKSLDFLLDLDLDLIKISSGDITNAPLLLKAAQAQKNIIISSGISTLGEIEQALGILAFGYLFKDQIPSLEAIRHAYFSEDGQEVLRKKVKLLQCTTEYPTPFSDINLKAMDTLKKAFGLSVGLSDHSDGIAIPIAAVALGAQIVEKHFTLDRNLPGPDHKASLEPEELSQMVKFIRQTEDALGKEVKVPAISELKNLNIARRSIVAANNIKIGEKFTENNLTLKRPGNGISPFHYWELLGQVSAKDYKEGELI